MADRELIGEWKELNKGWLSKFPYHEEKKTDTTLECWGYTKDCCDMWFVNGLMNKVIGCELSGVNIDIGDLTVKIREGIHISFEDYLLNWKAPTKKEKQMYNMLTGLSVPWSTEHPFKFVGEE